MVKIIQLRHVKRKNRTCITVLGPSLFFLQMNAFRLEIIIGHVTLIRMTQSVSKIWTVNISFMSFTHDGVC